MDHVRKNLLACQIRLDDGGRRISAHKLNGRFLNSRFVSAPRICVRRLVEAGGVIFIINLRRSVPWHRTRHTERTNLHLSIAIATFHSRTVLLLVSIVEAAAIDNDETFELKQANESTMTTFPSRIAFGACNDQDQQNNLWPLIEARKPAAFIWGGDAIYAGTQVLCREGNALTHPLTPVTRANTIYRYIVVAVVLLYLRTDIQGPTDWSVFPPTSTHECATPARLRSLYRKQRNVAGYRDLLEQNVTIFGTFDGEYIYVS